MKRGFIVDKEALDFLKLLDGRIINLLVRNFNPLNKVMTLKDFDGIVLYGLKLSVRVNK
jgi:hypothetical protein